MGGSVSAGRWEGPGAPSYISGPSPSESAPVPEFGKSVFHSSVLLICQNPLSWNPQFEHTIHRLVLYAFCL